MRFASSRRVVEAVVIAACALTFSIEQVRLVRSLLSRYTNEDHAVLWHAAADWARLHPREPTFYGQGYGVNLEAIPMAVLHALGMPYGAALPVALIGMAGLAWGLLAWAAWRRGSVVPALVAAAFPILLNTEHWIIVGVIGTGVGRLLAAACAALALQERNTAWSVFWVVVLGVLAVLIDAAAATLAAAALVWASLGWLRQRRLWSAALYGLLPPAAWRLYNLWFDFRYPDHVLHNTPVFDTSWEVLKGNLIDADRLFAQQGFELHKHGAFVLSLVLALWLVTLAARAWRELAAVTCVLALLLVLAAMPKSLDSMNTIWFPSARMSLTTPMAVWFSLTAAYVGCSRRLAGHGRGVASIEWVALSLVTGLVVWTSSVRALTWTKRLGDIEEAGLRESRFPLRRVDAIEGICREANRSANEAGTRIVLFPLDRTSNYACAALYPSMITGHPGYERRYWILRRLASRTVERMLVWDVGPKTCKRKQVRNRLRSCTPVSDGHAVRLEFDAQSPLDAARVLGFDSRPFGPDCKPNERWTCLWWAARFAQ
jgi:hypothetical protein